MIEIWQKQAISHILSQIIRNRGDKAQDEPKHLKSCLFIPTSLRFALVMVK